MVILVFTFAFLMLQITNVDGIFFNMNQNCHTMATAQCQVSPNLKKYTKCWEESIENCGYNKAENNMRSTGGDCFIEEHLITENICYMPDMCQDVTYTEYNFACYE